MLVLGRRDAVGPGDVHVDLHGSFSATLTVPRDASPGEASLSVTGSPYDDCPDDASCAGYGMTVVLLPAS
jgi:hypothetical protein